MSKRKISERNLLIEQCLHDAYCEANNIINEGVWDNIKAGAAGAAGGAWNALKTDAKNSFSLKSKDELKADAKNAYNSGRDAAKIKSYAKSLSKTMQDFINAGGKLGTDIDDENDVVERLKRVTQGLNPGFDSRMRKKAETGDRREQIEPRRQGRAQNTNNQKTPQPQQTPQSPTTATDPRYNNQKTDNQGAADETPKTEKQSVQPTDQNSQPTSQTPVTNTQSNNTDEQTPPVNSDGQTAMLNSIPKTTSKRTKEERLAGIQNARKIRKQAEQEKAKRDKARRIRRGEEKSTIAKVGDGIKNLFTRKKSKGQNNKTAEQSSQQPQQTTATSETNNQDINGGEQTSVQTSQPSQNNNPPSAKQLPPPEQKQKGSNVNFDYQTDTVTGGMGDTMSGVAYDGYTQPAPAETPNNALPTPNNTLPAPNNDQQKEEKQRKDVEDTMEQMKKFGEQTTNYGAEWEERLIKKKRKKITESFKNTSAQITMLNSIK